MLRRNTFWFSIALCCALGCAAVWLAARSTANNRNQETAMNAGGRSICCER